VERLRAATVAIFVIAALIGGSQQASASTVQLVANIEGSGSAFMDAASPLKGTTTYFIHVRLYSDGTAIGRFDCVDLAGSTISGDFSGPITRWKIVNGELRLSGSGELRTLSGILVADNLPYTVGIQRFGGAGDGHWTLQLDAFGPAAVCSELLTSGRLVMTKLD
jgi:hypothetical protein